LRPPQNCLPNCKTPAGSAFASLTRARTPGTCQTLRRRRLARTWSRSGLPITIIDYLIRQRNRKKVEARAPLPRSNGWRQTQTPQMHYRGSKKGLPSQLCFHRGGAAPAQRADWLATRRRTAKHRPPADNRPLVSRP
jgi:hypothetical protein